MIRHPYRIGDDRQRRIHSTRGNETRRIDHIEVVKIMRPAMNVQNRSSRIGTHTAGPVLVAYAFDRNSFLEVGVERH